MNDNVTQFPKKEATDDIITLVMITGAEIVGKLVQEGPEWYVIYKPRMVQAGPKGIGLVDGISMTGERIDGEFSFPKSSVQYTVKTVKEVASGWMTQTSGLVVPPKGIV